jgi:LysM repeat protein
MNKSVLIWFSFLGIVLLLILVTLAVPTMAAPAPQYTAIASPTPGPDGRIIYIVQEGDTLWRISAITGISLDELRRLNNLTAEDIIQPGERLLLGLGGPSEIPPTEGPPPTPTSDLPTATPMIGTGILCISVFVDVNGDAIRQEEELDLEGSAISISNRTGSVSLSQDASGGLVPRCYEDIELGIYDIPGSRAECISIVQCALELDQGLYNISVAIPEGYNATTSMNHIQDLEAGFQTFLDFGAQTNSETAAEVSVIPEGGQQRSPLLAIIGIGLLVVGIGLGVAAFIIRK